MTLLTKQIISSCCNPAEYSHTHFANKNYTGEDSSLQHATESEQAFLP